MTNRNIIWPPAVKKKLLKFRSEHFTPEETLDFISQVVLEIEDTLKNPILGQTYTEESGSYKGISHMVIKKFRIYFERMDDDVVIIAILFPGEK
ncbi:type II toxin-antitoxin system RelE/ParE family toxin [Geomicrobium sediminis]|uniref:Plasmid stabilization system protein ParE n=1 Tax=Geomicrobium sediminis TaxID=1347788 RepID=A0ABS2PF84_9BACL|nr:type II toxin-antitoxin system RelE/ParE family toxin [Geomicrobium sediminis]MBM7634016.1 plasmid stabilization system protein ParE [Geomicrobium sediminis]